MLVASHALVAAHALLRKGSAVANHADFMFACMHAPILGLQACAAVAQGSHHPVPGHLSSCLCTCLQFAPQSATRVTKFVCMPFTFLQAPGQGGWSWLLQFLVLG